MSTYTYVRLDDLLLVHDINPREERLSLVEDTEYMAFHWVKILNIFSLLCRKLTGYIRFCLARSPAVNYKKRI